MVTIRRLTTVCLVVGLSGLSVGVCRADEVDLNSGERLIGTVTRMADGKLIFQSRMAGEVKIAVKDIRSLTTEAPVTLVLPDGTTLQKRLFAGQASGSYATEPGRAESPLAGLRGINPPPPPRYPLHGNAAIGYSVFNNTINSTNFSATTDVLRERPTDKLTAGIAYVNSRQSGSTTADSTAFNTEYDYGLSRPLYGFFNGGLKTDRVQNLQLRTQVGTGIGYQWVRRPKLEFGTTAGFSYLGQKFKAQSNQTKLTTQFGSVLDTNILRGTHFRQTLSYFPNINDFENDYYLLAQFILDRSLGSSITANVRYVTDYTSRPGPLSKRSTGQFIVGVGKNF